VNIGDPEAASGSRGASDDRDGRADSRLLSGKPIHAHQPDGHAPGGLRGAPRPPSFGCHALTATSTPRSSAGHVYRPSVSSQGPMGR
jgi:hypothetical protein